MNYFFELGNAFHASNKYLIELGNELFDTEKWNQKVLISLSSRISNYLTSEKCSILWIKVKETVYDALLK